MLYIILMHISHFMFFANDLLLAVYFIFTEIMLDKKQIQVIFLFSAKWVIKQQTHLITSTMHLAQELLMNVQCSGGSRSFAKEMSTLKMRSTVASHQKLTKTSEGHLRS